MQNLFSFPFPFTDMEFTRPDGRKSSELRPLKITRNYLMYPEGSVLIEQGDTKIIVTASIENKPPPFLMGSNNGWITAEYSMLRAGKKISI